MWSYEAHRCNGGNGRTPLQQLLLLLPPFQLSALALDTPATVSSQPTSEAGRTASSAS